MTRHRFLDLVERESSFEPTLPPASAGGFMLCPPALQAATVTQWQVQQLLYRWAFEQAQAVLRPSALERFRTYLDN